MNSQYPALLSLAGAVGMALSGLVLAAPAGTVGGAVDPAGSAASAAGPAAASGSERTGAHTHSGGASKAGRTNGAAAVDHTANISDPSARADGLSAAQSPGAIRSPECRRLQPGCGTETDLSSRETRQIADSPHALAREMAGNQRTQHRDGARAV